MEVRQVGRNLMHGGKQTQRHTDQESRAIVGDQIPIATPGKPGDHPGMDGQACVANEAGKPGDGQEKKQVCEDAGDRMKVPPYTSS